MLIPKHLFERLPGRQVARGAGEPQAGGHRRPTASSTSGRATSLRGEMQPELSPAEPAALRHHRDEGRRRRGLGGARGAADRRVRLRLEPAGRGRRAAAHGKRRQGARASSRPAAHSSSSSSTATDPCTRGRRRARAAPSRGIRCWRDPAGAPGDRRCCSIAASDPGASSTAAPASATRERPQQPGAFPQPEPRSSSSASTRPTRSSTAPAGSAAATACARRTGASSRFVFQTSINSAAPEGAGRSSSRPASKRRHGARAEGRWSPSVYFCADVAQPRHQRASSGPTCRCTLQTMGQPDPGRFMDQLRELGVRDQGQQVAGPQLSRWRNDEYDRLYRAAEAELDPVKRVAAVHPHERPRGRRAPHPAAGLSPAGGGSEPQPGAVALRLGQRPFFGAQLVSQRLKGRPRGFALERGSRGILQRDFALAELSAWRRACKRGGGFWSHSAGREPRRTMPHRGGASHGQGPSHRLAGAQRADARAKPTDKFVDRATQLGYVEGQTLLIDYRSFDTLDEGKALAAELVRLKVDLIVAQAPPALLAARSATQSVPIVTFFVGDPVRMGIVPSLARPGGNVTGFTWDAGAEASRTVARGHEGALSQGAPLRAVVEPGKRQRSVLRPGIRVARELARTCARVGRCPRHRRSSRPRSTGWHARRSVPSSCFRIRSRFATVLR